MSVPKRAHLGEEGFCFGGIWGCRCSVKLYMAYDRNKSRDNMCRCVTRASSGEEAPLQMHPYLRATRTELSSGPLVMVSPEDGPCTPLINSLISLFLYPLTRQESTVCLPPSSLPEKRFYPEPPPPPLSPPPRPTGNKSHVFFYLVMI